MSLIVVVVALGVFFVFNINKAQATAGKGDLRITIDTQLNSRLTGAYFHFLCDGNTIFTIYDGAAGDGNAGAGIIDIASTSSGFSSPTGGAGCGTNSEAFTIAGICP
ncbi:MAG: hypothetical protein CEN90_94 [Parcubacteria group bacterium Licking1014_17]|nr:MAG: hypothetical protein CEN90_94 [Parcubacteria group bacterium Licking1014_17]